MTEDSRFCYLKGFVDCQPWQIQECNMKQVVICPLETDTQEKKKKEKKRKLKPQTVRSRDPEEESVNTFCYLKGLVDCTSGTIQDCNMKRVTVCPLINKENKE